MFKQTFLPLVVLASCTLGAAAAPLSPPPRPGPQNVAEQEFAAAMARAESRRGAAGLEAVDAVAPVLTKFDLLGSINVQTPPAYADVDLRITDNLSGVIYYYYYLRSPSGRQTVSRSKTLPLPTTPVATKSTIGMYPYSYPGFTVFSEPGVWTADYLYAQDTAGNTAYYDAAALDAIGNHRITVTNTGGYDATPPTFEGGTILTTSVRLAKPPAGTPAGTPPWVSADLNVTDAGNGRIAGAAHATFALCRTDTSGNCTDFIYLTTTTNRTALPAATIRVGTQLSATQATGTYRAYYVALEDAAGNFSYHYGTEFGGDIDFSEYFPVSTIFVRP